jgi:hypothetical protein
VNDRNQEDHVHHRHQHEHGAACGHLAVIHDDHVDYVHDGHLHHPHGDHVDEHQLAASDLAACDPKHACGAHPRDHVHGVGCNHVAIPHDGHIDYVVEGHIHRQHGEHCDDHGELRLA